MDVQMKPVMQTKTAEGEGNCFNACVASLLEIEIDTIPEWEEKPGWSLEFEKWLSARFRMYPIWINRPFSLRPFGYYILSGKSPRGEDHHSIVMFNGEFSHDPFPGGGDSLETALESTADVCVLVPIDPADAKPKVKAKTKTKVKTKSTGKKK